jgi:chaperonin GroES
MDRLALRCLPVSGPGMVGRDPSAQGRIVHFTWHSVLLSAKTAHPLLAGHLKKEITMKIRPLHDRVVIRRVEEETKTAGGILLPGSAAEKPSQGEVVAVGKGLVTESGEVRVLDVKVGDKVLFGQYSGSTVKVDGEELLIMKESEIFGVLDA